MGTSTLLSWGLGYACFLGMIIGMPLASSRGHMQGFWRWHLLSCLLAAGMTFILLLVLESITRLPLSVPFCLYMGLSLLADWFFARWKGRRISRLEYFLMALTAPIIGVTTVFIISMILIQIHIWRGGTL